MGYSNALEARAQSLLLSFIRFKSAGAIMNYQFRVAIRYIILICIGSANVLFFQNCSKWQGDINLDNQQKMNSADLDFTPNPNFQDGANTGGPIKGDLSQGSTETPLLGTCDANSASIKLGCPEDMTGTREKVCENGTFKEINLCHLKTCKTKSNQIISLGQTLSIDCESPMKGQIIQTCLGQDQLEETSNTCVNSETKALCEEGEIKEVSCNSYFSNSNLNGSIQMKCSANHKNWEAPKNPMGDFCTEIKCNMSSDGEATVIGGTREVNCPKGMSGKNIEVCTLNGDGKTADFIRISPQSSCLPVTCQLGEKVVGFGESISVSTCPEKDFVGTQVFQCDSKGVLTLQSNSCLKPKALCSQSSEPIISKLCSLKYGNGYSGYIKLRCNVFGSAMDVEDTTDCKMQPQTILDKPNGNISATLVYPQKGVSAVNKSLDFYFSFNSKNSCEHQSFSEINKNNVVKSDIKYSISDLNIGIRAFTSGFPDSDGKAIKIPGTKDDLVENFGILFETQFQLSATDEDGDYQLATISDDGSILEFYNQETKAWQRLVDNSGMHAAKMSCALKTLKLTKAGKPVPIRILYYQGPKYQIALDLVARKVNTNCAQNPQAKECADFYCGKIGENNFYLEKEGVLFKNDFAKHWKALRSANFSKSVN